MLNSRSITGAVLLALILAGVIVATAAPPSSISSSVAVCDPFAPQHCSMPDADGKLPISGTVAATVSGSVAVSNFPGTQYVTGVVEVSNILSARLYPSAEVGATTSPSAAAEGGRVVLATPGTMYGLQVTSGASAGYVLVFDSAAVPADGAVTPFKCHVLAANSSLDLDYRAMPLLFQTGVTVVFSTTGCFTKTASSTAFISGDVWN